MSVVLWPPVPWQKFLEAVLRGVGDARQDIGQPGLGVDIVELGGLCRTANYAEHRSMRPRKPAFSGTSFSRDDAGTRHSLARHRAFRNSSRRSFGRNRFALSRSYGLSFASAASLSSR